MRYLFIVTTIFIIGIKSFAMEIIPDQKVIYKVINGQELTLHFFFPKNNIDKDRTTIIHFFGGGWAGGNPKQFYQQCSYLSSLGYITVSADYRVMKTKGVTPFDCVEDARDAIRFLRKNAKEFGINPQKIIASGGSAGGHIALCTSVFNNYLKNEDISSVPNGLILYNPVLDTTEEGYGKKKFNSNELLLSPNHSIHNGMPPTIIFHGTADKTVPYNNALKFKALMDTYGNSCQLIPFEGENHGFFNGSYFRKGSSDKNFNICMEKVVLFLKKNGFDSEKELSADNYHCIRDSLVNSTIKFNSGGKYKVAFVGGSITHNKGWRNDVCKYLEETFPSTSFDFIEAGIPSHGSTSAAFRIERDVLSLGKIDLCFVEAAVNDRSPALRCDSKKRIRGMEGIVRHIRQENLEADIVMLHFVDQHKMTDYNMNNIPQEIKDHETIAKHYNISSIHLAKEVTERINNNEFTWEDDFKNLHPSPFGQVIYGNSIKRFLDRSFKHICINNHKITSHRLPEKLDEFCYDRGEFIEVKKAKKLQGFKFVNNEIKSKDNKHKVYLEGDKEGASFTLEFKGKAIGFVVLSGPDTGMIEYKIDDSKTKVYDLYTNQSWLYNISRYFTLEDELNGNKNHKLEIKIIPQNNRYSKGNKCVIQSFYVNK